MGYAAKLGSSKTPTLVTKSYSFSISVAKYSTGLYNVDLKMVGTAIVKVKWSNTYTYYGVIDNSDNDSFVLYGGAADADLFITSNNTSVGQQRNVVVHNQYTKALTWSQLTVVGIE